MVKKRRLLDEYQFPGVRPRSAIQGMFGDPKARIIRLDRSEKKRHVAVAGPSIGATTTRQCGGYRDRPSGGAGYPRGGAVGGRWGRPVCVPPLGQRERPTYLCGRGIPTGSWSAIWSVGAQSGMAGKTGLRGAWRCSIRWVGAKKQKKKTRAG